MNSNNVQTQKVRTVAQVAIGKGLTLEVWTKYYGGYCYMVKNVKVKYHSFIGNYDQLIAKGYRGLRDFYGVSEDKFLVSILSGEYRGFQ